MKKELRERVLELKSEGYTRKEIGAEEKITYAMVCYYINTNIQHEHGDRYKAIIEDSKNLRQCEIVKKYGVSRQYVSKIIQNANKNKN